ncbi:SsgA family sporulation/cell division regulator [Streptomyces gelaticus]|uniref:SsgA family sporulation/cell division regulator n=1 Tax=Streptomyces gelaticus TaxID=285446 RepID=UPI00379C27E5
MRLPVEKRINVTVQSVVGEWYEVSLLIRHLPDDPLAVRMDFLVTGNEPPLATWVFSRDLLATGLILPSGEGDVRVRPHGEDETDVELISGRAWCVVRMASADVRDFVVRTRSAEEYGGEEIDTALDRMLMELLPAGFRNGFVGGGGPRPGRTPPPPVPWTDARVAHRRPGRPGGR